MPVLLPILATATFELDQIPPVTAQLNNPELLSHIDVGPLIELGGTLTVTFTVATDVPHALLTL